MGEELVPMDKVSKVEARDRIHQVIEVGDIVSYNPPYFKGIVISRVESISPSGKTMVLTRLPRGPAEQDSGIRSSNVLRITEQFNQAKMKNPEFFI